MTKPNSETKVVDLTSLVEPAYIGVLSLPNVETRNLLIARNIDPQAVEQATAKELLKTPEDYSVSGNWVCYNSPEAAEKVATALTEAWGVTVTVAGGPLQNEWYAPAGLVRRNRYGYTVSVYSVPDKPDVCAYFSVDMVGNHAFVTPEWIEEKTFKHIKLCVKMGFKHEYTVECAGEAQYPPLKIVSSAGGIQRG